MPTFLELDSLRDKDVKNAKKMRQYNNMYNKYIICKSNTCISNTCVTFFFICRLFVVALLTAWDS